MEVKSSSSAKDNNSIISVLRWVTSSAFRGAMKNEWSWTQLVLLGKKKTKPIYLLMTGSHTCSIIALYREYGVWVGLHKLHRFIREFRHGLTMIDDWR